MRYIIRAVPERDGPSHDYLREKLPEAEWVYEDQPDRTAENFTRTLGRALRVQGSEMAVHLDDDVILTQGFDRKVKAAVWGHERDCISLYSMRKEHAAPGLRRVPPLQYLHGPAFYMPPDLALPAARFFDKIIRAGKGHARSFLDDRRVDQGFAIGVLLHDRGRQYRVLSPSLVQHRAGESSLGHARSFSGNAGTGAWISPSFVDPWE